MNRNFIERLYNEYFGLVKLIVKNAIHTSNTDDISACIHDVFVVAMEKDDLDKHKNIKAWLFVTAKNVVKTFNRQKAIDNKYCDFAASEPLTGDFTELVINKIDSERLKSLDINRIIIESLSQNERDFYELLYCKKMSVKEISKTLNISEGAAATRRSRLKEKIKKLLENL